MHIGLLDDHPAIVEYLSQVLQMSGHQPYAHSGGNSLLTVLFEGRSVRDPLPYDLVILDLLLPDTPSGLEVIQCLAQALPRLPIIIVSALSQAELDRVKEHYPALPILQKPFKPHQLLQLVNEARAATPG